MKWHFYFVIEHYVLDCTNQLDTPKNTHCAVQHVMQSWGALLKRKVARISTSSRESCLAPSDACRGYALYAANTVLNRQALTSGQFG